MALRLQPANQTVLSIWLVFFTLGACIFSKTTFAAEDHNHKSATNKSSTGQIKAKPAKSKQAQSKQPKTSEAKQSQSKQGKNAVANNTQTEAAQGDLQQIQEKIQALSSAITISKQAQQGAHEALKASETAISTSRKQLRDIQEAQQQNREQLQELQRQMSVLQKRMHEQQSLIGQQLNQQYRHSQNSPLKMLLHTEDPSSTSRNLKYLGYLTAAHQQQIDSLQDNQAEIDRVRAETAEHLEETNTLAKKYAEATQKLEQDKHQRAQALAQISKQIETQEQQLTRLKRDEEALSQLIQKLMLEARKRQQEEEARSRREKQQQAQNRTKPATSGNDPSVRKNGRVFEHAPETRVDNTENHQNTVVAQNDTLPEQSSNRENFAQLKGRLRLPVRGEVINRFGAARTDTGVSWKGLFIRANEGSEVKSVATGQVVFADWMRGFGNLIVIDHGNGYMSLYGNNEALFKSNGQHVLAGDTVATVGNSGGNANSGVYYELRHNSVPFNPMDWSTVK